MTTTLQPAGAGPTPPNGKYTPRDLIALSAGEVARRAKARADLTPGAWAHVKDAAVARDLGEETVRIVRRTGSTCSVATFLNELHDKPRDVAVSALEPSLAIGDKVKYGDGRCATIVSSLPDGRAYALSAVTWTGNVPETIELARLFAVDAVWRGATSAPGTPVIKDMRAGNDTLHHDWGCAVRGAWDARQSDDRVGPSLSIAQFGEIAAFGESCYPRRKAAGDAVTAQWPTEGGSGNADAVLCDFAGGATVWIWRACLVAGVLPVHLEDTPSAEHRPALENIYTNAEPPTKPDVVAAAREAAEARQRALPPGAESSIATKPAALAAATGVTVNAIDQAAMTPKPQKNMLYIARDNYGVRRDDLLSLIRKTWSEDQLADADDELNNLSVEDISAGTFEVRSVRELELPDDRVLWVASCLAVGDSDNTRYLLLTGLLEIPRQLAIPATPAAVEGGIIARTARGAGSMIAQAVKDGARATVDYTKDEVSRKGLAVAKVASEGTIVAGHEVARRTFLALGAAAIGSDPEAAQSNVVAVQAFDTVAKAGMRIFARALGNVAPGVSKIVNAAADTLEAGIDRKQATTMLDQVAPAIGGGLKALAQAAAQRVLPALAAPAPIPAPALEPAPEDRPPPKPRRARKPKPEVASDATPAPAPTTSADKPATAAGTGRSRRGAK